MPIIFSRERQKLSRWSRRGAAVLSVGSLLLVAGAAPASAGPAAWHLTRTFSQPVQTMTGVDCSSAQRCVATTTNGQAVSTTNGWQSSSHVAIHGAQYASQMNAVSCPTISVCQAVGTWGTSTTGYGVVVHSSNAGATWTTQHVTPVPHVTESVSCPTSNTCVAAGVMGGHTPYWMRTTNGGVHWSDHTNTLGPNIGGLSAVSCPTTATCAMVGVRGDGAVTTNGGIHWTLGTAWPSVRWLYGESCLATLRCVAVGQSIGGNALALSSLDGGVHWSLMPTPKNVPVLYGVDCLNATTCFAVGRAGNHGVVLTTTNGTNWSSMAIPATVTILRSVDCRSTTWCTAVGGTGTGDAVVVTLH